MGKRVLEQIVELWERGSSHVWRLVYLVSVLAFFLPFASIKGCNEKEYKEYGGLDLVSEHTVLVLPIIAGLLFFVLSFRRQRGSLLFQGFLLSGEAVLAWLAGIILQVWLPIFAYFLSSFVPKIGLYLSAACWDLVFIASLIATLAYLFKMRRLQVVPRIAYPKHVSLLLLVNYLCSGILVLWLFLVCYYVAIDSSNNYSGVVQLIWITFAVSFLPLLYFLNEGLKRGEIWAGKGSIFIAGIFLLVGGSWSYYSIQEDELGLLWIFVPLSLSATIALVKSIQLSLAMALHQRLQRSPVASGNEGN